MADKQQIFDTIKQAIADSCGIEPEKIKPESKIFDDLGMNSVDLVDVLYTVEMEYDISLKIRDFERMAQKMLGDKPYKINRRLTEDGAKILEQLQPELKGLVKPGMTDYEVIQLLTVESLVNMTLNKLKYEG